MTNEQDSNPKTIETLSPEDQEILQLQNALAASKKRKDEALELARQKAATELQNRLAAEAKKRADDLLEYQAIIAKHEEKRRLDEEAKEAARREEARKRKALEDEAERCEQLQRERAAHARRCADLAEAARREEMEAEAIQRELLRTSMSAVEEKPITITDARHPLSMIFGVTQLTVPEPTAPVQVEPVQIELRNDSPEEQSYVMSSFINKGFRPNPLQVINLLKRFEPSPILNALNIVAADTRLQGRDAVQGIEALLWNPEADPKDILNNFVVAREAEEARLRAEKEGRA